MLEVIEGIASALRPDEMISLLHQLVQQHYLLSEPADDPAKRRQAAGKLLHVLELGGWL
jgi:hypothetical protein